MTEPNLQPPISYKDYMDPNIIHGKRSQKQTLFGGIGKVFFEYLTKHGDKVAQVLGSTGESETYASLKLRSIRTALEMKARGIKAGDIITICSLNHMDVFVPFLGATFVGAIVASTDPSLLVKDTVQLLSQVAPTMIFCDVGSVPLIEGVLEKTEFESLIVVFGETETHVPFSEFLKYSVYETQFSPIFIEDDKTTAVIHFSSGTTGLPKGICLPHRGYLYREIFRTPEFIDATTMLTFASLYWISATAFFAVCLFQGGRRIICPKFDEKIVLKYYSDYNVTYGFLAPSQAVALLRHGRSDDIDTSHLSLLQVAGGPVTDIQLARLKKMLPETFVYAPYGQTESVGFLLGYFFNLPDSKEFITSKPASCGQPLIGVSYKIIDLETGKSLGIGKTGELCVKSDFFMNGYYQQDSSCAWDAEGWLHTGDVLYYDEDHCFFIVDRIKDMLRFQAWPVVPAMLEAVLYQHPAVKEAVVVGIPHEEDGDHPLALVALTDDTVAAEEIEKFVEEQVHDRDRLRGGVKIFKTIPKTPTGKFRRRALRDLILAEIKAQNPEK